MRAGSVAVFALACVAALPRPSAAQQFPLPHGPAALSVPHPLPPPVSTLAQPPRDLYQQPTPRMPPPVIYPGYVYLYGPFVTYNPYGPYGPYVSYALPVVNTPAPVPTVAQGGLRLDSSPALAEVKLAANRSRDRGDLLRLTPPATPDPVAPPARSPQVTYIIPNCYAGNRPPSRTLPRGCDISKMVVRKL
jgi:hypothetical protein